MLMINLYGGGWWLSYTVRVADTVGVYIREECVLEWHSFFGEALAFISLFVLCVPTLSIPIYIGAITISTLSM
jgi:hypothetical protein